MNRMIKCLSVAALMPLAVACSKRQEQAPAGSPVTDTSAPSTQQPGQSEAPRPTGQMGTEQPGSTAPGDVPDGRDQPRPGLGSGLGQPGEPQAGATNERALCDALASGARLQVEDVQNGVAIVATPKQGGSLSSVRDDAKRLESAIHMGAGTHGGAQAGETCGIAELGRLPNVSTQVIEGQSSVRIVMTTANSGEVSDLRRMARTEISSLMRGGGKPQQ